MNRGPSHGHTHPFYTISRDDPAQIRSLVAELCSRTDIQAIILNGGKPVETGDAAGHLGVAHALIGHLRAFGFNASQGRIFLPWSVFAVCGVEENEVLAGQGGERMTIALTRLSDMAREHLAKAEVAINALPRNLRPMFAPVAVLKAQLAQLDVESPFQRADDLPDWRKIALLWWWRARH